MVFMKEEATDGAGPTVEVFVGTPYCGVDLPVVEFKGDVSDCVGEIPYYEDAEGAGMGCYKGNGEELAGVELDPGEEEDGGVFGVLVEK